MKSENDAELSNELMTVTLASGWSSNIMSLAVQAELYEPEKYDVIVHTIAGLPASTLGIIASTKSCTLGREDFGKAPSSVILL